MTKLMIDHDGVLDNYVDAFRDCISEQRGWTLEDGRVQMGPAESWTFYKQSGWNMTTDEFLAAMKYATIHQNLSARALPYPGVIDGLWKLSDMGHELYIVSSRLYGPETLIPAYTQTWEWLDDNNAPHMKIILIGSGDSKVEVCLQNGLTMAIEDSPTHFETLTDAGIDCYLMHQIWNDHIVTDKRVWTFDEFVKQVW